MTGGNFQLYYATLPFNYLFDEAMNMMVDAFRYPLYKADRVKNEIQAVNHEFYDRISTSIELDIIRQKSSVKTSFNGMGCGNNQTLKPSESELLSKKLKGYHMVIKNPENMFFVMYTNKSISESEEYAKKYLNYKMHIFPNNEIDETDKKKLEQNIKDIESIEIFDENIYKHGIYYNTYQELNLLKIYYYIGKLDYKETKLDIIDYFGYLFKSESLFQVLKGKNYIEMDEAVILSRTDFLDNNDYFRLVTALTNGYTPLVMLRGQFFIIYEQGLYKEVDSMEDDINRVLLDVVEGRIDVQNFKEIYESYNLNIEAKKEKNMDNLFDDFISEEENKNSYLNNEAVPKSFSELVEIIKPILINPTRLSILIARNTLSDEDYKAMLLKRSQINEYILNKNISITHRQLDS